MLTQGDAMKRILSGATRKLLRRGIGPFLTARNAPSGINRPSFSLNLAKEPDLVNLAKELVQAMLEPLEN